MRTFVSSIAVAAVVIAFSAPAAMAQAYSTPLRTYVSRSGSDNNTNQFCNDATPCRTFIIAISVTSPGGEIRCLDDSYYGGVNITKSVTIDCDGVFGSADGDLGGGGTTPISINGSGIVVTLRGLSINGNGSTGSGILVNNAAAVTIENCVIQGFNGQGGAGIRVQTDSALQLNVTDTLIANNSSGNEGGIVIFQAGYQAIGFAFDRIRVENNAGDGIAVVGSAAFTGPVTGVIRDSVITGSTDGIIATTGGSAVTVSLDHTHVANNGTGVTSLNGAAVILNNSTIQTNGTGLSAQNGGAIFSYGNNAINGNQPNGSATPTVIGLH
jgi:hypothetical protein